MNGYRDMILKEIRDKNWREFWRIILGIIPAIFFFVLSAVIFIIETPLSLIVFLICFVFNYYPSRFLQWWTAGWVFSNTADKIIDWMFD